MSYGRKSITPKKFFKLRSAGFGGKDRPAYASKCNFSGVYILYNKTRRMYYIGQVTRVLDRVNSHFTGKENGDVYADYKYGDRFSVKMVALKHSRCSTLNELERKMIEKYDSFAKGYNKTRGNRG